MADKLDIKVKDYDKYKDPDEKPNQLDFERTNYLVEFPNCTNYIHNYFNCVKGKAKKPELNCTTQQSSMHWCVLNQFCPNEFKSFSECAVEEGKDKYSIPNIPVKCYLRYSALDKCLVAQTKEVEKQMEANPKWKKIVKD